MAAAGALHADTSETPEPALPTTAAASVAHQSLNRAIINPPRSTPRPGLVKSVSRAKRRKTLAKEHHRRKPPTFVLPVAHYILTARFGQTSNLWSSVHTGQDFAAPTGTLVTAVADGRIVAAGWAGPYGRRIIIRHKNGIQTWYCHLSKFLKTSGWVTAGTPIGRVGSTGNTTGPHLHLEVRVRDVPINPVPFLRKNGVKV